MMMPNHKLNENEGLIILDTIEGSEQDIILPRHKIEMTKFEFFRVIDEVSEEFSIILVHRQRQ